MYDTLFATACGRVVHDPEVRETKDGKPLTVFDLAVNTDKDHAVFLTVSAFGTLASTTHDRLSKGDRVTCIGNLDMFTAQKSGKSYLRMILQAYFPGNVSKASESEFAVSDDVQEEDADDLT